MSKKKLARLTEIVFGCHQCIQFSQTVHSQKRQRMEIIQSKHEVMNDNVSVFAFSLVNAVII